MKKADRPEQGEPCGRCRTINRPERSFCRHCGNHLKRQPIARGRPPKPISEKRANERDERARVIALVVARDQTCQAQAVHALAGVRCSGPLDCHERIPRSAWPGGYLEPSNVILVCRSAHDWIDNHPNGAHALGLHGYSYERP